MKKFLILLTIFFAVCSVKCFTQESSPTGINWLSFQEALEKQKEQPKKMLVDVYTDWCGWCKQMDKTTFAHPAIIQYINQNYYAVKFNAEGRDTIMYKGKQYTNSMYGKLDQYGRPVRKATHDLAVELLNKRLSYPSLVYMDDSSNVIAPIGGYRDAKDIQPFLIFFAENHYKYMNNLQKFVDDFNIAYTDSLRPEKLDIAWTDMQYAIDSSMKLNKKVLIVFETDWCVTCNMMKYTTYNDTAVVKLINDNFIPVRFNALTNDTLVYSNNSFVNEGTEHPFHQFAVNVMQGKMQFPSMAILTPEHSVIQLVPGYFTEESIKPALYYFGAEHYKTTSWNDFLKTFKP